MVLRRRVLLGHAPARRRAEQAQKQEQARAAHHADAEKQRMREARRRGGTLQPPESLGRRGRQRRVQPRRRLVIADRGGLVAQLLLRHRAVQVAEAVVRIELDRAVGVRQRPAVVAGLELGVRPGAQRPRVVGVDLQRLVGRGDRALVIPVLVRDLRDLVPRLGPFRIEVRRLVQRQQRARVVVDPHLVLRGLEQRAHRRRHDAGRRDGHARARHHEAALDGQRADVAPAGPARQRRAARAEIDVDPVGLALGLRLVLEIGDDPLGFLIRRIESQRLARVGQRARAVALRQLGLGKQGQGGGVVGVRGDVRGERFHRGNGISRGQGLRRRLSRASPLPWDREQAFGSRLNRRHAGACIVRRRRRTARQLRADLAVVGVEFVHGDVGRVRSKNLTELVRLGGDLRVRVRDLRANVRDVPLELP
jgi:hypothetical protein